MTRTRTRLRAGRGRGVVALAALAVVATAATACGSSDTALGGGQASQDNVIVGSANFPENELLAEIYAGGLQAAGVNVTKKLNIGAREIYLGAMQNGEISVIPDYTGNLLLQYDKAATAASSDEVYTALQAALPQDLKVLEYSPAEDKDVVAVTPETAQQYNLKSIEDMVPVCGQFVVGGSGSFETRQAGLVGLKDKYGCTFQRFQALDTGGPLTVQALKDGTVQAADLYSTDPTLVDGTFVSLADPKNVFPAQNVVPLYKDGSLSDAAKSKLNDISKALDTATLASLLRQVSVDNQPAQTVAGQFLKDKGLG
ncbi:ABC transporter substrate-binding protein [Rhodococcus aerolatus]